jgi:hypothetical protein
MVALYMGWRIWAPVVVDGLHSISRSVQDGVMVPQAGNPYTQVNTTGPQSANEISRGNMEESYSATVELPLADSEHD